MAKSLVSITLHDSEASENKLDMEAPPYGAEMEEFLRSRILKGFEQYVAPLTVT
jgi:hypothetical protein